MGNSSGVRWSKLSSKVWYRENLQGCDCIATTLLAIIVAVVVIAMVVIVAVVIVVVHANSSNGVFDGEERFHKSKSRAPCSVHCAQQKSARVVEEGRRVLLISLRIMQHRSEEHPLHSAHLKEHHHASVQDARFHMPQVRGTLTRTVIRATS